MKRIFFIAYLLLFIAHTNAKQKHIQVIIPSYNNSQNYERNLTSILNQDYQNWDALYFDDASTDGTADLVEDFLKKNDSQNRIKLIRNQTRRGALANHWSGAHATPSESIIVNVDGDDHLAHPYVLSRVNDAHKTAWVTYGQYREYPSGKMGASCPIPAQIIDANQWRDLRLPLPTSHLRTFRASLFKQIPLQDLLFKGAFFAFCPDIAFFFPILEMAGHHVHFISSILYEYNTATPLNEFKVDLTTVLQTRHYIQQLPRYQPLKELPQDDNGPTTVDLCIFSYDRPLQLQALLASLDKHVSGLGSLHVLYRTSNQEYADAYEQLKKRYDHVVFVAQESPPTDFKTKLITIVQNGQSDFCMFAIDDQIVIHPCDLHRCVEVMRMTHAYGFFLRLGQDITDSFMIKTSGQPPLIPITNDVYAWQFGVGSGDWGYQNTLDMTIYKKSTLLPALINLEYSNPTSLEARWYAPDYVNPRAVGLCYQQSKVINILKDL